MGRIDPKHHRVRTLLLWRAMETYDNRPPPYYVVRPVFVLSSSEGEDL